MSGNVHPNPGPLFPCSVCAGNVTWRGKSVQCCTCSKWVHLRCSQLSLSKFRAIGSSHSWSCPPPVVTLWLPPWTPPTCIPPLCNLAPPLLMLHSRISPVSKPPIPHLPILYLLPLLLHHRPLLLAIFLRLLPLLLPLTLSGFFNGMLEVFKPGALNYFIFYRPIQSILSVSRNPILSHLPLSGLLNFLLCVLIAPTPGLAFSLSWYHARQRRRHHFRQTGPILFWTFYLLSFFAWSLLWLCRGQHLSQQLLLGVFS